LFFFFCDCDFVFFSTPVGFAPLDFELMPLLGLGFLGRGMALWERYWCVWWCNVGDEHERNNRKIMVE